MLKFGVGRVKYKTKTFVEDIFQKLHFWITLLVKDHACDILIIFSKALHVCSDERFEGKTVLKLQRRRI